ncbi:MAG: LysM peptidoglycan-binding domain-containing protein [Lachnospira sp.]|nr:LysM peptidoglycan-binding domain-containing protein [Lachnospira sp.]
MDNQRGFFYYTIRRGDTIYKIANEFGSSIQRIIIANPGINIYNLNVGDKIIVPIGNVTRDDEYYNSSKLNNDLKALKMLYPFIQIIEIGRSVRGVQIQCVKIGVGTKEVSYNASFHANELITTNVLMRFIEEYARAFVNNDSINGHNAKKIYYNTTNYIVPLVNTDGVDLVTESIPIVDNTYINAQKIANNYPAISFPSGWKANIQGVDLNLQFPARMGRS